MWHMSIAQVAYACVMCALHIQNRINFMYIGSGYSCFWKFLEIYSPNFTLSFELNKCFLWCSSRVQFLCEMRSMLYLPFQQALKNQIPPSHLNSATSQNLTCFVIIDTRFLLKPYSNETTEAKWRVYLHLLINRSFQTYLIYL